MPKYFITILVVTMLAIGFVTILVLNARITDNDIMAFNAQYEVFNKNKLNGSEIYSVINKAIDNNKKEDVEIYNVDINLRIIDFGEEVTVNMEKLNALGMDRFYEYYGRYEFKCTSIKYDENTGRIKELNFENI